MKNYEKPYALSNEELSEGIYTASGDNNENENEDNDRRCRFGRHNVKVNASDCKKCVASGGTTVSNETGDVPGHMEITADQCPDGMPEKKK